MNKLIIKIAGGALVGFGVGMISCKHKIDKLKAKQDRMTERYIELKTKEEDLERQNNNLAEVNRWMKDCMVNDKEET